MTSPEPAPCRWTDEQRCTAVARRTGERCRGPRLTGARVCRTHGGSAPQVRAAAAERALDQRARTLLAELEIVAVEDPLTELGRLAGEVVAWKNAMRERVGLLNGQLRYSARGVGTEQLRAEVALFERAMDRCSQILGLIARLNIDERLARISERQADAVIEAVEAGIATLGLTDDAVTAARQAVARRLRAVSSA